VLTITNQIVEKIIGSETWQTKLKKNSFIRILLSLSYVSHIVAYLDSLQAKVDRLKALQAQTAAELVRRCCRPFSIRRLGGSCKKSLPHPGPLPGGEGDGSWRFRSWQDNSVNVPFSQREKGQG